MNPFEEYTLLIGALAVILEGGSYLRELFQKIFH
jgi:hypothetical protein